MRVFNRHIKADCKNASPTASTTSDITQGVAKSHSPGCRRAFQAQYALQLVESVSNIVDVDAKPAENSALPETLLDEAADLFASAGYERDAYLQWATATN